MTLNIQKMQKLGFQNLNLNSDKNGSSNRYLIAF